jgi:hypothetical protein
MDVTTRSNAASGEKPHRHHSYNGHNSSKKFVRDLPKSKSNNRIEFKPKREEQGLLEKDKKLKSKEAFASKYGSLSFEQPKITEGVAGEKIMSQNSEALLVIESSENNTNRSSGSGANGLTENSDYNNRFSQDVDESRASGFEENKNRYNVLVSQLPSTHANSNSAPFNRYNTPYLSFVCIIYSFTCLSIFALFFCY